MSAGRPLPPMATWWDLPFLAALVLGTLLLARVMVGGLPAEILVRAPGETRRWSPGDRRVEVAGPLGTSVLELDSRGGVRFLSSPCPGDLCVRQGRVDRAGAALVCVPNQVLVELVGAPAEDGLDGVTR